jgi:hypothetical protein
MPVSIIIQLPKKKKEKEQMFQGVRKKMQNITFKE